MMLCGTEGAIPIFRVLGALEAMPSPLQMIIGRKPNNHIPLSTNDYVNDVDVEVLETEPSVQKTRWQLEEQDALISSYMK